MVLIVTETAYRRRFTKLTKCLNLSKTGFTTEGAESHGEIQNKFFWFSSVALRALCGESCLFATQAYEKTPPSFEDGVQGYRTRPELTRSSLGRAFE